jgi:DNA-binding NtrC family response regulator
MLAKPRLPLSTIERIVSIVGDELDITDLFDDALRNNIDDTSIVTFNDPIIALEDFVKNKQRYALVISDLRMPGMNGLELLKKVKKLNSKVRTILVSAYEFETNPVFKNYLKEGIIDSFIENPITINRLCQRVRDEFGLYQLALNYKH